MKQSLFHHDQLTEPLDIYWHNMHYLKVNVIGNISSIIHFSLRQIFNPFKPFLTIFLKIAGILVKPLSNLGSRDLGHVTKDMKK